MPISRPSVVKPKASPGLFGSLSATAQSVIGIAILNIMSPIMPNTGISGSRDINGTDRSSEAVPTKGAPSLSDKKPPMILPAQAQIAGTAIINTLVSLHPVGIIAPTYALTTIAAIQSMSTVLVDAALPVTPKLFTV